MKKLYRVLPIVLSVGLFGCNNSSTQESASASRTAINESKDEFVSKLPDSAPTVKVATEANYAPYDFKDEFGNVTGFDVDLMRYIGENQGFKIELYNDAWEVLFQNLDNKSRDMIAAGISYSEERATKYAPSDPYVPLPSTLVYLDNTLNINSLNDLSNVRIGVLSDSSQSRYFNENKGVFKSLEEFPTTFAALQAMAQDQVDAVAGDSGVIRYTIKTRPGLKPLYFDYEGKNAAYTQTVFLIDKDQPELLSQVNAGLKALKEDGTYGELTTKWFGTDLTKASLEQQQMSQTIQAK